MRKLLLLILLAPALLVGCVNDEGEPCTGLGSLILQSDLDIEVDDVQVKSTSTEVADYTVILEGPGGSRSEIPYPSGGKVENLAPGSYTVTLTSHPGGIPDPAFDTPVYTGSATATVTAGAAAPVAITCEQANAGVYFIYDPSLAEFGMNNVIPTVTQSGKSLEYSGANKDATGHFAPGAASISVKNGTTPITIGGQTSKEVTLGAKQLWAVTIKVVPSVGGLKIVASVDITTIGKNTDIELDIPVWSRNTLKRLNLHGKVKTVSEHVIVQRDNSAYNLVFNEQGWITSFTHIKSNLTEVAVTVTHDAYNRVSRIKASSVVDDYVIDFTYGSHGKYIATDDIINEMISAYYILPYHIIMPTMVKGLDKVTITDKGAKKWELKFGLSEGKNTASLEDGYGVTEDYFTYTFEGNYMKTAAYEFWGMETVTTYTIDTATGCILKTESTDDVVYTFANDRLNSLLSIESAWTGNTYYTLNENLDVVKMKYDNSETDFSYDFDEKGNWLNMHNDTQGTYIDRVFQYWD